MSAGADLGCGSGGGGSPGEYGPEHRLERLAFFSDAIFAIAVTILVIDIRPPRLPRGATDADWWRALAELMPNFGAYALSFVVIGALWTRHHATFSLLSKFSPRLMWPSLLFLMSIAFVPFSTALLAAGSPSLSPAPFVFYSASLLVAGLLKSALTLVAVRPDLVAHHVTPLQIEQERRSTWVFPAATLVALSLAFVTPGWNNLGMFSIGLFRRLPLFGAPNNPDR